MYFKGCFICVMTCDMSMAKFYEGFMQHMHPVLL